MDININAFFKLRLALGSDDLQDAYHGVPNIPSQLPACVVAPPDTPREYTRGDGPVVAPMVFAIAFAHLFGLLAAVANSNRLPELLTAVCRRVGCCMTWHFSDGQGTVQFECRQQTIASNRALGSPKRHRTWKRTRMRNSKRFWVAKTKPQGGSKSIWLGPVEGSEGSRFCSLFCSFPKTGPTQISEVSFDSALCMVQASVCFFC